MEKEISKKEFEKYRYVQDSGLYNMLDPRARNMTTLSREQWISIMRNYDELKTKYEKNGI